MLVFLSVILPTQTTWFRAAVRIKRFAVKNFKQPKGKLLALAMPPSRPVMSTFLPEELKVSSYKSIIGHLNFLHIQKRAYFWNVWTCRFHCRSVIEKNWKWQKFGGIFFQFHSLRGLSVSDDNRELTKVFSGFDENWKQPKFRAMAQENIAEINRALKQEVRCFKPEMGKPHDKTWAAT